MATLNTTYTFTNGNVAEAGQVNTNFNDVESWVSTNLVQIDGSVQAPTIAIADGAITSAKILNGTIVTDDIADNAITSAKILDGAVNTGEIALNAVITDRIALNAIITDRIALNAVITDRIAVNAIVTDRIAASAVTNAKLNNGVSGDIPLVTVSASAATGGKNGDVWIVV